MPEKKVGYVASFIQFHERGVAVPPHDFFHVVLFHYDCELHHLNSNGIQQLSIFVASWRVSWALSPTSRCGNTSFPRMFSDAGWAPTTKLCPFPQTLGR